MPLVNLPQFTEIEPKIGPVTFKQFFSLLMLALICFLIYTHFPTSFSRLFAFVAFFVGAFLILGKIEGMNAFFFLSLKLKSIFSPKILFWGGKKKGFILSEVEIKKAEKEKIKTKRESSLKNLVLKVLTKK